MKNEFKQISRNFALFSFSFLFFIFYILYFTFKVAHGASVTTQATVATPSATQTASPSASPEDEKVKEIRDVVKEKVQEKIQEIKNKIEKKGYVGILTEMTDSTLTLQTLTGEKMVQIASQAAIIGTSRKEIKAKDLEIDQKVICMGVLDENNFLVAKRIVVVAPPKQTPPKRQAFIARISDINSKTKTLTLNHLRKLSQQYLVKIDKDTKFAWGKFEDLKVDNILVVISSQAKETETPTALLIKTLP